MRIYNSRLIFFCVLACVVSVSAFAVDDHILVTEAVATPTTDEFIEIHNGTGAAVALDNYYLTDDQDYCLLPGFFGDGPAPGTPSASDFIARFPAGTTMPNDATWVIAFSGAGFLATFGFAADFEIKGDDAGTPDMLDAMPGGIGSGAGLTNSGENATLFFWDGSSDLVQDVDMANIGTPSSSNTIADKTGVAVDGPDADTVPSTYANDAFTMPQMPSDPGFGFSAKRTSLEAPGSEVSGAGNGLTGDDETTEDITVTWDAGSSAPTPGSIPFVAQFSIDSITPISGNPGDTLDIDITGISFDGATTFDFGADITVNSTTINNATSATVNITIAPLAALGFVDVVGTRSPGGLTDTLNNGFEIVDGSPVPVPAFDRSVTILLGLLVLLSGAILISRMRQ